MPLAKFGSAARTAETFISFTVVLFKFIANVSSKIPLPVLIAPVFATTSTPCVFVAMPIVFFSSQFEQRLIVAVVFAAAIKKGKTLEAYAIPISEVLTLAKRGREETRRVRGCS